MKVPPVKYMRDFYPEEMRLRQWIEDQWRTASERAGLAPWDAPIVESLDLYTRKSGDEIVGQLYTLVDRGERELAIRPEMTPSLARMIAARAASLPRPIKWYTIGRMCRYERGQRGRLREFWQWNVDILGAAGSAADAEVIGIALDALETMGLSAADVEARINSRDLLAALLGGIGIPEARHAQVYAAMDKRGKVPEAALDAMLAEIGLASRPLELLRELITIQKLDDVARFAQRHEIPTAMAAADELEKLFDYLAALGKSDYARYDIGVVRGLAYYTGPVFEIFDREATLRAVCGGGRYDRLLETMGGQPMPAVGFGMGDVVLAELLAEKKKLPSFAPIVETHVIPLDDSLLCDAMKVAHRLRAKGERADYALKAAPLGKALKRAAESGARYVILIGLDEVAAGSAKRRDLASGAETILPIDKI